MQTMVPITALELTIDSSVGGNFLKPVHDLYPMPDKGFHISKSSVNRFAEGLREIRNYLKIRAFHGFTAAIILSGHHTEDGVLFGGQ